jgi:hypothetical protein
MAEYTPTLVAIYDVGYSQTRRVAEFRLSARAGLHPNAVDGAAARLEKIRELGKIPADAVVLPP